MNNINNCKGCIEDRCIYANNYSETCPCIICLVKMVCKDICDDRVDFGINARIRGMKGK